MSRFFDLVSTAARNLGTTTKVPGSTPAALECRSRLVKLDSNENPFGPSPLALDAMRSALGTATQKCESCATNGADGHGGDT